MQILAQPLWTGLRFAALALVVSLVGCGERGGPVSAQAADEQDNRQNAKPDRDNPPDNEPADDLEFPYQHRIACPELEGGAGWLNTAGPLELKALRGKFVVLDFWTYCCINCMHILPELKKLERAYPNQLVVIGVHSAKFENEEDSKNIAEAIQRYDIEHPVVNDSKHAIWQRFGVNSWPTVYLIDPDGNLVWGRNGEVEFKTLDAAVRAGLPYYRRKGVLDETPLRFDLEADKAQRTPLRYPGKLLADEAGDRLFIADSNHHRIVIARLDGTLLDIIGSGTLGADDGGYDTATFNHPQGMALRGSTLYVADTENHLLRKVDLEAKQVTTIAGTGKQRRSFAWPGMDVNDLTPEGELRNPPERFVSKPLETAINSPWDLCLHGEDLYIAMAGPHQIWRMSLDESEIGPYAGNGREDIVDGPLLSPGPYTEGYASFAQPSGLASDGEQLFVADSEGSSIRAVPLDGEGEVRTIIGTAKLRQARLFTFGDVDGRGARVRLQHPLGVAYANGHIYVADTYNNKIKVIDLDDRSCQTLAGTGRPGTADEPAQFDEPAGLSIAGGKLYVADTNNHLIRVVDLETPDQVATLTIAGLEPPETADENAAAKLPDGATIDVPPATLRPEEGAIRLKIELSLPEGYKINPRAPMSYRVEAAAKIGPVRRSALAKSIKREKPAASFEVRLPVDGVTGEDLLKLTLTYYYCQEGAEGLCKVGSAVWSLPVTLSAKAKAASVPLKLEVE